MEAQAPNNEAVAASQELCPPLVVVMGVTGSGKNSVGELLAERIGVLFADGDDYHPKENIEKMSAGEPLTDGDREPWLRILSGWLSANQNRGGVLGCSALKRTYRDILREHAPNTVFLHLTATREVIRERVQRRADHFMPDSLVDSQFDTLEPLHADEIGVDIDAAKTLAEIVTDFVRAFPAAPTSAANPDAGL